MEKFEEVHVFMFLKFFGSGSSGSGVSSASVREFESLESSDSLLSC